MGRYDGEEYEAVPACRPGEHSFGMNGSCFVCRRSVTELLDEAEKVLRMYGGLVKRDKYGNRADEVSQ